MTTETIALKPLAPEQWNSTLKTVLDDMKGRPLNIHRLLAHHPALLQAWWSFRNYSVKGGALTARQRELAILRVAHTLQSSYEWESHVERGFAAGLSLQEIERVKAGPGDPDWTRAESLLLRVVDDCLAHSRITPDTQALLGDHFSPQQLLDLIAIQSMYQMLGAVIGTWGLELDEFIELPEGYQRDLT